MSVGAFRSVVSVYYELRSPSLLLLSFRSRPRELLEERLPQDERREDQRGAQHHAAGREVPPEPRVGEREVRDAWFGWYFAPGGVVLGPALFFTVFIVGQALVEKVTGTGPKGKKKD